MGNNNSVLLRQKPKVSVYSKINPENIEDNSIIEVDGTINTTKEKIYKTFDHHRTGELINSDTLPQEIESLEGKEIATHMMDSDFIISSAIILAGGKSQIITDKLKILESASRYCDLLEDKIEEDEEIKNKGLALHLYIKNKGFKLVGDLARERGETKEIAPGKFIPNALDKTNSEVAEKLIYELLGNLVSNSDKFNEMQDLSYLSKKAEMQEKWQKACIRNDEKFALIETQEFIDPLFAYELVKGDIQVIANKQENGYKYSVGVKPSSYEKVDLTKLIERLNEIDPNVVNQEVKEGMKKETWGGRNTVMGSPFRINSGLSIDEIQREIEKYLENPVYEEIYNEIISKINNGGYSYNQEKLSKFFEIKGEYMDEKSISLRKGISNSKEIKEIIISYFKDLGEKILSNNGKEIIDNFTFNLKDKTGLSIDGYNFIEILQKVRKIYKINKGLISLEEYGNIEKSISEKENHYFNTLNIIESNSNDFQIIEDFLFTSYDYHKKEVNKNILVKGEDEIYFSGNLKFINELLKTFGGEIKGNSITIKGDFQKVKEFTKENIVNFFSLDEGIIELDNKDLLFNDYGKYRPNITLLTSKKDYFTRGKNFYGNLETEEILDTKQVCEKFNIENYGNSLSAISGDYWKSKKGTNCFRAKKAGKHYLIIEDWGGSFGKGRGGSFEALKDQILYSRKASSNGGGNGYSYAIVAKNARVKLSIEDI